MSRSRGEQLKANALSRLEPCAEWFEDFLGFFLGFKVFFFFWGGEGGCLVLSFLNCFFFFFFFFGFVWFLRVFLEFFWGGGLFGFF